MSRYADNPLMEPIFFTPPRGKDRSMPLYKGGGGGGGQVYYENQDKLLGVQADIAQNMYNQYAEYAPARLEAMRTMADEAMDGSLAARARSRAAADAGSAMGQGLAAAQRGMARYGTSFQPNRLAQDMTSAGIQGAAMKADGMNKAEQWAEGQKWARNADMYSNLAGMPGNAVSALNSAAGGYGQMAGQQTNLAMAGAQGAGQFGSMLGYAAMHADGGYIEDDAPGYAMGGMPKLSDWRNRPSSVRMPEAPSTMESVVAGAAPMIGAHYMGEGIKSGIGALKGAFGSAAAPAASAGTGGASLGSALTSTGGVTLPTQTLMVGDTLAVAPEIALEAVPTVTGTAGAGLVEGGLGALGSAAMTAAPWLAGGYLLGDALDLWADGGEVPHKPVGGLRRKDMRPGGHVSGPGTETSDSIPAWLSDGEYVLNSQAVKEVGKKKLDKINERGLKKRAAKAKGKK